MNVTNKTAWAGNLPILLVSRMLRALIGGPINQFIIFDPFDLAQDRFSIPAFAGTGFRFISLRTLRSLRLGIPNMDLGAKLYLNLRLTSAEYYDMS